MFLPRWMPFAEAKGSQETSMEDYCPAFGSPFDKAGYIMCYSQGPFLTSLHLFKQTSLRCFRPSAE